MDRLLRGCWRPWSPYSCWAAKKQRTPEDCGGPAEVGVIVARPAPIGITSELPGRLEAYRQAEVRARVAGIVTRRLYEEGQDVRAGTVLFQIDPAPLKAALDISRGALARAEASHAAAADKLKRYADLIKDRAISEREYTEAQTDARQALAQIASAKAELEQARLRLGYATVTAPIDGRARRALVTEGALVGEDSPTPLTRVEQIDPIYVNFSQPAGEVAAMQRGDPRRPGEGCRRQGHRRAPGPGRRQRVPAGRRAAVLRPGGRPRHRHHRHACPVPQSASRCPAATCRCACSAR